MERLLGKAGQFRRVAARREELEAAYLGLLRLTPGFIRLRRHRNIDTPELVAARSVMSWVRTRG